MFIKEEVTMKSYLAIKENEINNYARKLIG